LIDFGQVKQFTDSQRVTFSKLIVALSEKNSECIIRLMREMGHRTQKNDAYVTEKTAIIYYDRDDPEILEGKSILEFFEFLSKKDKTISAPNDYMMAGRVALFIRAPALAFGYPVSIAESWKSVAEKVLKDNDVCFCFLNKNIACNC
jgi:predicted unusual protein kinase regulating ubiquinone biosynthesis (AarF/ABC1/UbiB family)